MLYETDIINDIYDYIFMNDCNNSIDFVREFPDSFIDFTNARIYLCDDKGEKFIIKIERG